MPFNCHWQCHRRTPNNSASSLASSSPLLLLPFRFFFIAIIIIITASAVVHPTLALDSPCADQLQRCGVLVEDFERQLQDLKNLAFRSCFTNTACIHEKIAFDECFVRSLQAVRAPFGDNAFLAKSDFLTAAEDYRAQVELCFAGAAEDATVRNATDDRNNNETGEDVAHLGRVVFGPDLGDHLWGLPAGDSEKLMDPMGGCPAKDAAASRIFGGGISRIVEPAGNAQLTNLNVSCTLTANELACFRRALDHDPQYRQLMSSRDRALRSCLQNVRTEQNCQFGASPHVRTCICSARQELDGRMQMALLSCVQHSTIAQLYAALASLNSGSSMALGQLLPPTAPIVDLSNPPRPRTAILIGTTGQPPLPPTSLQIGEEPLTLPSTSSGAVLTQGSILNGQCLCACPISNQKCPLPSSPSASGSSAFAANTDFGGTETQTVKVARLPAVEVVVPSTATVSAVQMYRPVASIPWYYQPLQTALSAEAGIANGFERFFNGQAPLKKRKKRHDGGGGDDKVEKMEITEN